MSTRATYQFVDKHSDFTVFKHHDGYPEGGLQWIARALKYAWPLPRFEADEFAASFVAANKPRGGGGDIRLTTSKDVHGDTEYHYVVTRVDGKIHVQVNDLILGSGNKDRKLNLISEGFLDDLLDKYAPGREWIKEV